MKKKIICIIINILIITVLANSVVVSDSLIDIKNVKSNLYHIPSWTEGDEPLLIADYYINIDPPELEPVSYNDDLIYLFQQLDEELYLMYLENLTAFGPRVTGTEECVNASEYIYNQFESMGIEAEYFYWEEGGLSSNNIIGTLYGENQSSDEIYIICGHYDSVEGSPGADDDGSGTVAVITAAYLMSNAEFNHTIKFIAFSGEEQGLIGSYHYAQEAAQNGDNIKAVLNLDMISYAPTPEDTTKIIIFDDEDQSVWLTDFIDEILNVYYSSIGELEVIRGGWSWGSDHYYFWQFGFSAIFGHEYIFNPHWHQPTDIIENCNISYGVKITKLMIASLAELAGFITFNAPYIPEIPKGPVNGEVDVEYTYSSFTTDPQGDQIYYLFDWGDGTDSGWIGPYNSGEEVNTTNIWTQKNTFNVKVKAKDINDFESEWSDELSVNIPRTRIKSFHWFLERFPLLERLLSILLL